MSRLSISRYLGLMLLAIVLASGVSAAPRYRMVDLSPLQAANGINDLGQIVGTGPFDGLDHAMIWADGHVTDLGALSVGANSVGLGINNLGYAVGGSPIAPGRGRAFLWRFGSMTNLGWFGITAPRPSGFSIAYDVNDLSQVVGEASTSPDHFEGFIWQHGTMNSLHGLGTLTDAAARAVNNLGHVAGQSEVEGFGRRAVLWRDGSALDLGTLGGDVSDALDINDLDEVVGFSQDQDGTPRAFLWSNGKMSDLGDLGGDSSRAQGISNLGRVVGSSETEDGSLHAFLRHPGTGLMDLNGMVDPLPGVAITDANRISNKSWILATATHDGDAFPVLLVPLDPPRNVSLAPAQGSIGTETRYSFTTTFDDPDGALGISYCRFLINTRLAPTRACYVAYDAVRNRLYLRNDNDTSWLGGYAPGSAHTIANGYGRLYCGQTTIARKGTRLAVTWAIALKRPFRGTQCSAWQYVSDDAGLRDGWDKMGSFQVK